MFLWLFATLWTVCSLPDSSVHGVLQARILQWVAIPFSRVSSWPEDPTQVSHIAGRFFTVWATREAQRLPLFTTVNEYLFWIFKLTLEHKRGLRGEGSGYVLYLCVGDSCINGHFMNIHGTWYMHFSVCELQLNKKFPLKPFLFITYPVLSNPLYFNFSHLLLP